MKARDDDRLFYTAGGPLAAVLLGTALVPLRGVTTASNLTFAFVALTILVAELGGGGAAVATALSSSLSLDFFLTRPYLTLAIADKHDVIAFAGLTACGLVAAAAGSQGDERAAALRACRGHMDLVEAGLVPLEKGLPLEPSLARVLEVAGNAQPVAAAVVRDGRGSLRGATERAHAMPAPARTLEWDAFVEAAGRRGEALPPDGARLPLVAMGRHVGWLDVWGNGRPATRDARRALAAAGRLLALILAGPRAGGPVEAGAGLPESASRE